MSKQNDQVLREAFKKGFEQQFQRGLMQGTTAISGAVMEIAKDESSSLEERMKKIVALCSVALKTKNSQNGGESK